MRCIAGGKIGVLVEINCETDFVARTTEFQTLLKDIAMQIAAVNPRCVRREEVTVAELDQEKEIYRQQALESGKPEKVIDKIVEGKIDKFYSEVCLLEQAYVHDPAKSVAQALKEAEGKVGGPIKITGFVRYGLGEGIEKQESDFAAEVAAAAGQS